VDGIRECTPVIIIAPTQNTTRGPRAWRSADDFEEMERILHILSERRKYAE
jgi:hypothetical protein